MKNTIELYFAAVVPCVLLVGCATPPPPTGFISDYSKLQKVEAGKLRYISPDLKQYSQFMIDPVEMRIQRDPPVLTPKQSAEVATYMRDAVTKALQKRGYQLAERPDVGVARARFAITDVQKSKWYLNLHPATKLTGLGLGGASMEGEVVDSVTGAQLAASIQAGRGNQFELDTFKSLDDVKDVIDKWADAAGQRLDELHSGK